LKKNLAIFEIDARSLAPYITSERDAVMGISKMPLRRFRLREERLFNNDESSDEEEYEEEMKNAFNLLEERDREKQEENYNDYLNNLNNPEELNAEQDLMKEEANLIGGALKKQQDFGSYLSTIETHQK